MFKTFTAFDDIPGELQTKALELKDGSFVVPEEADNSALEKALRAARQERDEARQAAAQAREQVAEAQRKLDTFDATGRQSEEKVAQMLAKWEQDKAKAVADAVAAVEQRLAPLQEKVTRYELDDVLANAFAKHGGRAVKKDAALVLAKAQGWTLVDGRVVRKDANGEVLTESPDDYFGKTFRKDMEEWYEGTKASGGGAPGTTGAPTTGNPKPPTQWDTATRRQYIEEHGADAYTKLLNDELVAKATAPVSN